MPKTKNSADKKLDGLLKELKTWEIVLAKLPQIVYAGDKILRTPCKKVTAADFASGKAKEWSDFIQKTLFEFRKLTGVGRGLAANQVGIDRQIIVTYLDDQFKTYINPEIIGVSETQALYGEMCISFFLVMGDIIRPYEVTLTYQDSEGKQHSTHVNGVAARVILHEIAHLNGKLCIDEAVPTTLRVIRFGKQEVFGEKLKLILPMS